MLGKNCILEQEYFNSAVGQIPIPTDEEVKAFESNGTPKRYECSLGVIECLVMNGKVLITNVKVNRDRD